MERSSYLIESKISKEQLKVTLESMQGIRFSRMKNINLYAEVDVN